MDQPVSFTKVFGYGSLLRQDGHFLDGPLAPGDSFRLYMRGHGDYQDCPLVTVRSCRENRVQLVQPGRVWLAEWRTTFGKWDQSYITWNILGYAPEAIPEDCFALEEGPTVAETIDRELELAFD